MFNILKEIESEFSNETHTKSNSFYIYPIPKSIYPFPLVVSKEDRNNAYKYLWFHPSLWVITKQTINLQESRPKVESLKSLTSYKILDICAFDQKKIRKLAILKTSDIIKLLLTLLTNAF